MGNAGFVSSTVVHRGLLGLGFRKLRVWSAGGTAESRQQKPGSGLCERCESLRWREGGGTGRGSGRKNSIDLGCLGAWAGGWVPLSLLASLLLRFDSRIGHSGRVTQSPS